MKIFNHLGEQDSTQETLFAFDSPLYQKSKGALTLTIYLSSISVAIGLFFQFFPHGASTLVQTLAYLGLAVFVVMWAKYIDGTSAAAVEWIVNSLQNKIFWTEKKEKIRTSILLIKWSIAVVLLTWLSLSLSKTSAEKAGNVFSGEANTEDTNKLANDNEGAKAVAMVRFDSSYNQTARQFQSDISALESPYLAKIEQYQGYIKNAKLQKTGIELQAYINRQNGNIARQKKAMNEATANLRQSKTEALALIRSDQKAERERLNKINDTNFSGTLATNKATTKEHTKFRNTFSFLLSFIAGYSILIALLISGAIGLMKGRAGFMPKPVLTGADYKNSPLVEVLLTPIVITERLALNASRWIKDKLPDLREPEKEFSYNEYESNIIPLDQSEKARENIPATRQKKRRRIAAKADPNKDYFFRDYGKKEDESTSEESTKLGSTHEQRTHEIEGAHTENSRAIKGHTKEVPPNLELRQLKQRLKDYKKRLGTYTQKAKTLEKKGQEVPPRTLDAIANNRAWVNAYEVALNDKIQAYKNDL